MSERDEGGWPVRVVAGVRVCSRPSCTGGGHDPETGWKPSTEFRIDGFCSCDCRDTFDLEDEITRLRAELAEARERIKLRDSLKKLRAEVAELALLEERAKVELLNDELKASETAAGMTNVVAQMQAQIDVEHAAREAAERRAERVKGELFFVEHDADNPNGKFYWICGHLPDGGVNRLFEVEYKDEEEQPSALQLAENLLLNLQWVLREALRVDGE